MAYATAFVPTSMPDLEVWFGNILQASNSSIVIDDGIGRRTEYTGNFSYEPNTFAVFGTLESVSEFRNGTQIYSVEDIDVDAFQMFQAITFLANFDLAASIVLQDDDAFYGSTGSDDIRSYGGDDSIFGGNGDDVINGMQGDDNINGGLGFDTAVYSGVRSSYDIVVTSGTVSVVDQQADRDGSDVLTGIELLAFSDGDWAPANTEEPDGGPEPVPDPTTTLLDFGKSNVNVDGATSEFTDFGGLDTYTVLGSMSGDVTIIDNNPSVINLPEGLDISAALFLSDGIQFTVNGNNLILLGDPANFSFVFGGTPLNVNSGTPLTFSQAANAFGASIPSVGAAPNAAMITGQVQSDGTVEDGSTYSTVSQAYYHLLDQAAELEGNPSRLNSIDIDGIVFGITNTSGVTIEVTLNSQAANIAGTHESFVSALQPELQALIAEGVVPMGTTLTLDLTLVDRAVLNDGTQSADIPAIVLTMDDGSSVFPLGFSKIADAIGAFDIFSRVGQITEVTELSSNFASQISGTDAIHLAIFADGSFARDSLSDDMIALDAPLVGIAVETFDGTTSFL